MKKEPIVGRYRDQYGCNPSAGYMWSKLEKQCVRVFGVGIRLYPSQSELGTAILSTFILFNKDRSQVEVFMPGKPSTILNRRNSKTGYYWANHQHLSLIQEQDSSRYILKEDDKTIFSTSEIENK